jgi:predicted HTH domain antitoxin
MKLEIQVNVADDAADKVVLAEYLRKEAILALFSDRKIGAGKAAHELGMERLAFMELLKRRDIPYVIYSAEDWAADAKAVDEFQRRREIG